MTPAGGTAQTLRTDELLELRMRALGLAPGGWEEAPPADSGPGSERIAAVARRMLAVQGQDWRSARWALGVRAPGTTMRDVAEAFDAGLIVRSWPMRGTVHVVAAEDIGWMQAATNHRVLAGAPKRRAFLGMSDAALDRLVEVSLRALDERAGPGEPAGLDRDALAERWTEAGIEWQSSWRYHVIWWLCQNGLAVFGPVGDSGEPRLVRAEHWIRAPRELAGDAALGALAARYAAARGPIRDRDLAWWTGLTLAEARVGLRVAEESGALAPVRLRDAAGDPVSGAAGALWADPAQLGGAPLGEAPPGGAPPGAGASRTATGGAAAGWRLLAAFDEHLLGYTDRSAQLDPAHFERIVPGRNGMFLATIVRDGRVVGTWKRLPGKHVRVALSPFPGARANRRALAPALASWARFHALDGAAFAD
ncbi:winged helix DNA-binding domain-containing protein [Leucobacter allii]|uniref:winged helix DNA-binding domain-containing protein n=1 Tax=Leucobacter allii TaxID=2932247 RepID=UPI001FD5FC21|nr:winged helix DNA-binding domain-containing protein [Leucobacter allii]UOR00439.1 winged helix DNA-binding domain-containing protein [Leucobacter allii]